MDNRVDEDLWLGCCLGYRIGKYLAQEPGADLTRLIEVLKQIESADLALNDPGENAARFKDFKDISQSVSHAGNRADRDLARRALDQLANQRDV